MKCYQCTTVTNPACGDPFGGNDTLIECPISSAFIGSFEPSVCRKLKQTSQWRVKVMIKLIFDACLTFSWRRRESHKIMWVSQQNRLNKRWHQIMFQGRVHKLHKFFILWLHWRWMQHGQLSLYKWCPNYSDSICCRCKHFQLKCTIINQSDQLTTTNINWLPCENI